MEAYCFKCRSKREIKSPQQVTLKNGRPATQGVCPDCDTDSYADPETPPTLLPDPGEKVCITGPDVTCPLLTSSVATAIVISANIELTNKPALLIYSPVNLLDFSYLY